jgi:predicted nucleotidyltransferase
VAVRAEDIERAIKIVAGHGARRVLLFGSAAVSPETARDLDLACEGIAPTAYLRVLGELLDELPVLVDLVDLSDDTPFTRYVAETGREVYDAG